MNKQKRRGNAGRRKNALPRVSVIIPVYNEEQFVGKVVDRVRKVRIHGTNPSHDIVVVDDGSTDGTPGVLRRMAEKKLITLASHDKNSGKGAAIRTGLRKASGDIVLVQDADLEYDPGEYHKLVAPIIEGRADVVFGSRFAQNEPHRVLYFWHSQGNKFLTFLSNVFTDLNLTDMETGFKVFRSDILRSIAWEEDRFGFEPEITARVAKLARSRNVRIYEVGISYHGRTYDEGKKIGWRDGVKALYCIVKYNLFRS